MESEIFCPNCQSFVGNREKCDRCHWVREAPTHLIGQIHWETPVSTVDPIPGAPPFPARISSVGGLLFVPLITGTLVAVDASSGAIRWRQSIQSDGKRRTLAVPAWKDQILIGTEHLVDLPDQECELLAWNGQTGISKWTWKIEGDSLSIPLVEEDTAYIVSSDQRLIALDLQNQKVCWSARAFSWSPEQPALSGRTLVLPSRGPVTAAYNADNGRQLWTFEADDKDTEMLHHRPALSADTAYLAGWGKRVYAVDLQTGSLRWKFQAERGVTCAPVLAGDLLLIGVKDYRLNGDERKSSYGLYALDRYSGSLVWKFQTDKHIFTLPVAAGQVILFGADDRRLHMLDIDSGEEIWQAAFADKVRAGPFLYGDQVILGLLNNTLVSLQWRVPQPGAGDPDLLLAEGQPLEAAEALALSGKYQEAAALYARNGEPRHAAWLYVEAGMTEKAAETFLEIGELDTALELRQQLGDQAGTAAVLERMGKPAEAAAVYEEAGQLDEAVQAYIQADRAGYAAMLLWKTGRRKEAADLFRSINQDDQAAEVLAEDKRYAEAADIYLRIGKSEVAAGVLAQGGLLAKAAAVNEQIGRLKLAAEQYAQCGQTQHAMELYERLRDWSAVILLAEKSGDVLRLAQALQQTGRIERAAQEFERAGDFDTALELYQKQGKWDRAAAIASKQKKYHQQADALREQGLLIQAGEAYELAAEQAFDADPMDVETLADLYEAAAKCYAEDDDFIRYGQCWDKVCQYRNWPYLKGQFEIGSNFYQGEANFVTLVVKNTGYSPAVDIRVDDISQKFRLDELEGLLSVRLLGVQQDKPLRLLVQPRENFLGHVALWVVLGFKDMTGMDHEVKFEQIVTVLDRGKPVYALDDFGPTSPGGEGFASLLQGIVDYFDEDELRSLCFFLSVDFDILSGDNKLAKARELILYLQRRGKLNLLTEKCKELRPNGTW